jgi:hypothetical protein
LSLVVADFGPVEPERMAVVVVAAEGDEIHLVQARAVGVAVVILAVQEPGLEAVDVAVDFEATFGQC